MRFFSRRALDPFLEEFSVIIQNSPDQLFLFSPAPTARTGSLVVVAGLAPATLNTVPAFWLFGSVIPTSVISVEPVSVGTSVSHIIMYTWPLVTHFTLVERLTVTIKPG